MEGTAAKIPSMINIIPKKMRLLSYKVEMFIYTNFSSLIFSIIINSFIKRKNYSFSRHNFDIFDRQRNTQIFYYYFYIFTFYLIE